MDERSKPKENVMFTVKKTLAKTVEYKFNSLRELHDWAAANRYNKARNVLVMSGDNVYLDVRSIYEVFSFTLPKIIEL
jgi:hypothetical protein